MLDNIFSCEKKTMHCVYNLKQLHWIQPYEDMNLKLMRLQSSMMIIPNLLFPAQLKWMPINQSTVSLLVQERFSTNQSEFISFVTKPLLLHSVMLTYFGELKKILFVISSSNNSWKVLKLMLKMQDQAIANLWLHIQRNWSYSQENSGTWLIKSDLILNRKKGIFIKINQSIS